MKSLLLLFIMITLESVAQDHPAQIQSYSISEGCQVTSSNKASQINIHVEKIDSSGVNFVRFEKVFIKNGIYIPHKGFSVCDSNTKSGPVNVTLTTSQDYQKISMICGGWWNLYSGKAEMIIHRESRRLIQASIFLKGSYKAGDFSTGPIKHTLEKLSCQNAEYEKAAQQLNQHGNSLLGIIDRGKFKTTRNLH